MIKEELIMAVSRDTGHSKSTVADVIDATLSNIAYTMAEGGKVSLSGFGTFASKKRAARIGRNPSTGETIYIPSKTKPVFTAGKHLKELVERKI